MRAQAGYTLIMMLLLLISTTGAWYVQSIPDQKRIESANFLELERARQALIAYAVNYIDLYGPQGAGPGHFPCPDTDPPSVAHTSNRKSAHADSWHLDGPNPPCADGLVEHGWLPRYADVRRGRYHFHTRAQQRLLYAVSGNFVNNPVSRIVNTETVGTVLMPGYEQSIAIIAAPELNRSSIAEENWWTSLIPKQSGNASMIIRTSDVLPAVQRRVGGWLADTLNSSLATRCSVASVPGQDENSPNKSDAVSSDVMRLCIEDALANITCLPDSGEQLVAFVSTSKISPLCDSKATGIVDADATIDGVAYQRHWFFRNRWHKQVSFNITEQCLGEVSVRCYFLSGSTSMSGTALSMKFVPSASDND